MENSGRHGKTQSRIYNHENHGKHGNIVPVFLLFRAFRGLPFRLNDELSTLLNIIISIEPGL